MGHIHQLMVSTAVLDQMAKSVSLSVAANIKRRRRLEDTGKGNTRASREAAEEGELLDEGLAILREAQANSWTEQ